MTVKADAKVQVARTDGMMAVATTNNDDCSYLCSYRDSRGSDWLHCDYWDDPRLWGYGERGRAYSSSTSSPRDRGHFISSADEGEQAIPLAQAK